MNIIWVLILIVASSFGTIDAVRRRDRKIPYGMWKNDISVLFGQQCLGVTDISKTVEKLERMHEFERTFNIPSLIEASGSLVRLPAVKKYFELHLPIVTLTTLFRKTKPVSVNMIEIIRDQIGCSPQELMKLIAMIDIFQVYSRMSLVMEKKYHEQALSSCWLDYGKLIRSLLQLTSFHNYFALIDLSERINPKALNDYVDNQYDAESYSIEVLSNGIAKYLISLDHTDLENIPARNLDQLEKILAEVYEIEVYEPCNNLCNLWKPVRNYFSHLRRLPKQYKKYILHWIPPIEQTFEFSCKLASFSYTSIGNRVWDHFFNIKTSSMIK